MLTSSNPNWHRKGIWTHRGSIRCCIQLPTHDPAITFSSWDRSGKQLPRLKPGKTNQKGSSNNFLVHHPRYASQIYLLNLSSYWIQKKEQKLQSKDNRNNQTKQMVQESKRKDVPGVSTTIVSGLSMQNRVPLGTVYVEIAEHGMLKGLAQVRKTTMTTSRS